MILKFLLSSSAVKVVTAIVPFILIPFAIEELGIESYGKFVFSNILLTTLLPFVCLNIQTFQRKESVENESLRVDLLVLSNILVLSLGIFLAISSAVVFSIFDIQKYSLLEVLMISIATCCVGLITSFETYFTTSFSGRKVFLFALWLLVVVWGSTTFIVFYYKEPLARIIGQILAGAILLLISTVLVRKHLTWDKRNIKERLLVGVKFGIPLAAIALINLLMLHFDKLLISYFYTEQESGFYLAMSQLSMVIMFCFQSSMFAIEPLVFKGISKKLLLVILGIVSLMVLASISMIFYSDFLFEVLLRTQETVYKHEFYILIIANLVKGVCLLLMPFLVRVNAHRNTYKAYLILLICYVPIQLLLNSIFNLTGVSVGVLILNLITFVYLLHAVNKRYSIRANHFAN